MKKLEVNKKLFGSVSLSFAMIFTSFATYLPIPVSAAEQKAITTYQTIGKITSIDKDGDKINLTTDKEKIRITFLEDGVFRLNMEQKDNDFLDKPVPRESKDTAEILDKKLSDYDGPNVLELNESDPDNYIISTEKVILKISKTDSKMELINKTTGKTLWKEKEPLKYKDDNTVQTLVTDETENFYGGGMTNGYFSHKGTSIDIVKNPNKWVDGYPASPNPFYMSSKGYGVMRYTWMEGVYDFGEADASTVKASHAEDRFDAFYYVEDQMDIVSLIHDFTEMTGDITLLPEYAFYIGHLNCYSRDTWKEDPNGMYQLGTSGKKYSETKAAGDPITETLLGADKPSAQSMMQHYIDEDMPLGYFLPNDGYGCGYGRENTLDGNVANLKEFATLAKENNIETGLWTQSALTPNPSLDAYLQRDLVKEVKAGVHALKTDVAWVGPGYSMALSGVKQAAEIIEANSDYRRFIVSLDGWAGTQRYASLWSGDQTGGDWEYIRFHIPTYIGSGLSGNPNVGSDQNGIWGQNSVISTRDYQWKTFTPLQLDMDGWAGEVKNPSYYSEYEGINRMYLKMKAQMMPYIYTISREATDTSMPQIRAMMLEYPDDPYTYGTATQYQYMWGPNMLVAPIYRGDENSAEIRNNIYLPDEDQVWIDYFTGEQFKGGQVLNNFSAPIWKTPVFIKNGAIIPMTEENNTPSEIAADATRTFEVWPSGETSFNMYEDDGYSQAYKDDNAYAFTKVTSSAPVTGKGTAKITVAKPTDNYTATGNSKTRATEFVVNVQEKPSAINLTANGTKIAGLREVTSQADYDSATDAVYYYNEKPNLNKYEEAGSSFTTEIATTPKLYVKTAKMDVTTNEIAVSVEGFNNTAATKDDGQTTAPSAPANVTFTATDSQIDYAWDAVSNATTYEVRFGGETQPVIKNIKDVKYIAEKLAQDTEYGFSVRAVNSKGTSDWTTITSKTNLDRYRNVPKNMGISYSGDGQEPAGYSGTVLPNLIDNDNATEYSSKDAGAWANESFTIDMKKVYSLEKLEYSFRKDKSNGAVDKFAISYSKDGRNWTDIEWANIKTDAVLNEEGTQLIDTLAFDTAIDARYMKFTVKDATSGYLQGYEIRPYKVDKSEGYVLGDYSENGSLDDGDLVFMQNYIGNMSTDEVWNYTQKADQNKNNVIDGFDLAFLLSLFDGGNKPTENELRGGLMLVPEKTSLKKGETTLVTVLGVDLNDVYGLSVQLDVPAGLKYVQNSTNAQPTTVNMKNYSKMSDSNGKLIIALSNMGGTAPISGNVGVATFQLTATEDVDNITLTPLLANVVSSRITEKNAMMTEDTTEPTDPTITEKPVVKSDFTVSLTNDSLTTDDGTNVSKLIQGGNLNALFDGNTASDKGIEYKWDIAGNQTEIYDGGKRVPENVKLPLVMNFKFKQPKVITEFSVYNRNDSNPAGRVNRIKAIGYLGEEATDLGQINEYKDVYTFTNANSKVFDRIEIIPLESNGNMSGYASNTNTAKNGNNRMLTLREISFKESNNVLVDTVKLNGGEDVNMPIGGTKGVSVTIAPSNALNKNVKVESQDPAVASVIKMKDADGNDIYMLRGVAEGKTTVTATSLGNSTQKSVINVEIKGKLDLSEMNTFVDRAKAEAPDFYTPESWAPVAAAIAKAELIIKTPDSYTQSDVNKVAMDLSVGLSKLQVFETNPDKLIPQVNYSDVTTIYSEDNYGRYAFDGKTDTFFESDYNAPNKGFPANFTMKLAHDYTINQLDFVQANNRAYLHDYEVQVSMTGKDDDFETVTSGTLRDITTVQEIKFPKVTARYVRIKMLSGGIADCARIAELNVYGDVVANPATAITLDVEKAKVEVGSTVQLNATITPTDTTDSVVWSSSDTSIATVDESGKVTAIKEGVAIITAKIGAANLTATATIDVVSIASLEEAIADAEAFVADATNQAKYTTASWTAYLKSIADAKAVLANPDATGEQILEAAKVLKAAKENVLVKLATKDDLKATIESARKIRNGTNANDALYTVDSYENLQAILEQAQAIVDKEAATQDEVSNSNKAIKDAIENLVGLSELREAIADLGTVEGDFTVGSKAAYETALANAKAILAKADATAAEVASAISTLEDTHTNLVSIADLKVAIEKGAAIENNGYTDASYAALQTALKDANAVLANENATAAEVSNAITSIDSAIAKLAGLADKTDLQKALDDYADYMKNLDKYTDATATAFKTAYENATALNKDSQASQVDVDQATKALKDAATALTTKPAEPEKPVNPDQPGNPDQPSGNGNQIATDDGSASAIGKFAEGTKLIVKYLDSNSVKDVVSRIKDRAYVSKVTFEKVFDLSLIDKDNVKVNVDGSLSVRIKLDANMIGKQLSVVFIAEDGSLEVLPSTIIGDEIVFITTHNSEYAIVSYIGAIAPTPNNDYVAPSSPSTGDSTSNAPLYLVLLSGAVLIALRKTKKEA